MTRRELLAAVVVFTNKIRPYLLGRPFCLVRWSDKLQEFNYEMVHREGHCHSNADSLSRISCNQCKCPVHGTTHTAVGIAVKPVVLPEAASDKNISSLQLLDHDIGPILRRYKVQSAEQPEVEQSNKFNPATWALIQQ